MKKDLTVKKNIAHNGGEGFTEIVTILDKETLKDKGRLFGKISITPGCSVGPHKHEGEWEAFYILSGEAIITIDGKEERVKPGEMSFTPSGSSHSIVCAGNEKLEMIALILNA